MLDLVSVDLFYMRFLPGTHPPVRRRKAELVNTSKETKAGSLPGKFSMRKTTITLIDSEMVRKKGDNDQIILGESRWAIGFDAERTSFMSEDSSERESYQLAVGSEK